MVQVKMKQLGTLEEMTAVKALKPGRGWESSSGCNWSTGPQEGPHTGQANTAGAVQTSLDHIQFNTLS